MEENNSQEEHFRCTSAANGYTPLYRIIEKRHIDWYMAAASWYMLDVICIHLLPRLAEDSKRFKMGHLNWGEGGGHVQQRDVSEVAVAIKFKNHFHRL